MAKMSKLQKAKRSWRQSKAWKNFRHQMNTLQEGIDPITKSKLGKTANLHHRHVTADEEEYCDISNANDYIMLMSSTHKFLHWIYRYWRKDPAILDRIEEELEKWY